MEFLDEVYIMVAAVMVAIGVMMFAARAIGDFVEEHPTGKMLALAFLVMVGAVLMAEGLGQHMPKGYLYFAIAFSLGVEFLNLRMKQKRQPKPAPVHLNRRYGNVEHLGNNADQVTSTGQNLTNNPEKVLKEDKSKKGKG